MEKPSIHLNGTSAESLFKDYLGAYEAVSHALDALQKIPPHGRDYYVQPGDPYPAARAEHDARLQKLQDVKDDLEALALHCQEHIKS